MSWPDLSRGDAVNDSLELLTTPAGVIDTLAFSRQCDDADDSVCGVAWEQWILLSGGLYVSVVSLEGLRYGRLARLVAVQVSLEMSPFTGHGFESVIWLPFSSCVSVISMIVLSLLERKLSVFFSICFIVVARTLFWKFPRNYCFRGIILFKYKKFTMVLCLLENVNVHTELKCITDCLATPKYDCHLGITWFPKIAIDNIKPFKVCM